MTPARSLQLLALTPPSVWAQLLRDDGGVPLRSVGKLLPMLVAATLAKPLRVWRHARFSSSRLRIRRPPNFCARVPPERYQPPSQPPSAGSAVQLRSQLSGRSADHLAGRGRCTKAPVCAACARTTGPMDNVRVAIDMLQGEEFAVASSCHISWLYNFTMEWTYSALGVPRWDEAKPSVQRYLESLSSYRKNVFQFDQPVIDRFCHEWALARDTWGYKQPAAEQPRRSPSSLAGGL